MHLNEYLANLADLWPAMKEKAEKENGSSTSSESAPATAAKTEGTTAHLAKPRGGQPSLSLRDGLLAAGVGEAMMGIADAGYANTVGAALEDTSLMGTCFLEHEWDVDGDRTFVLKAREETLSSGGRSQGTRALSTLRGVRVPHCHSGVIYAEMDDALHAEE